MDQTEVDKKIIVSKPDGKRKVGRSRLRGLGDAKNDLR
jgi:hypothetical protein